MDSEYAGLRIFIVEAEWDVREQLLEEIAELGYVSCGAASNYNDALRLIREASPDLVLLGIKLVGDRDGIDLAHRLRRDARVPFAFVTAQLASETLRRVAQLGAVSYVLKPVRPVDLDAAIRLAMQPRPLKAGTEALLFQKRRFLVIDRDPKMSRLMVLALRRQGAEVDCTAQVNVEYDLVVRNEAMSVPSEVSHRPVLTIQDLESSEGSGQKERLAKPFHLSQFYDAISGLLSGA